MRPFRTSVLVLAGLGLLAGVVVPGCSYEPYEPPPLAFSGDSTELKSTVVVPTLDTPAPAGQNVLWCGTFQQCWDQMRDFDSRLLTGPADVVRRLNAGRIDPAILPPGGTYTAVGWGRDGIVETIRTEMAKRFPDANVDLPIVGDLDALAYAYLQDAVTFHTPYFDVKRPVQFTDSAGKQTPISAFGLREGSDDDANKPLAQQIAVLYADWESEPGQFILDLDKTSKPTQLILACVPPGANLAETWQAVQQKMRPAEPGAEPLAFRPTDRLVVPNLNYVVRHAFTELEETGQLATRQSIEFRLDRTGARLISSAYLMNHFGIVDGHDYEFTRPFLIALRQRGQQDPYFVMWVDNAELLCKPQ